MTAVSEKFPARNLAVLLISLAIPAIAPALGSPEARSAETEIGVEQAWARASIGTARPTAAYVTVVNRGAEADRLLGVDSPAAGMVQVHRTTTENGRSRMAPAGEIPLAPGGRITMKPGGYHIMLMQLKAPVAKGSKLPLVLRFRKAGEIKVEAEVLGPGARGPEPK